MSKPTFGAVDYAVLIGSLLVPASVGTFFAWHDRQRRTNREFLVANRQLRWLPVSLSMMASFLSPITMLGVPSEVFVRGSVLCIYIASAILAIGVATFVFLPVYYNMEVTSINEYLEGRFNSTAIRNLASALFIIQTLLYMGIVLYGPSLALGSVTGLPVWGSILLNGFVCTFYTAAGGMKAVVWTDTIQMALIYTGYIMVIGAGTCVVIAGLTEYSGRMVADKGVQHAGGFSNLWKTASVGGRLSFINFSFSPYDTYTTWNCLAGGTLTWLATYGASQTQVQRYSSIRSLKHARRALMMNIPYLTLVYFLSVLSGLTLYAVYHDCDPRLTGDIQKADQLMPHAVQTLLQGYPGLAGLFVAAVFSGSLSTLSSGYNALAAVTWEDFVRPRVNINDAVALRISKCIAVAYGMLSISIAFLAGSMESIVHATASLQGALSGPLLALFSLGVFAPFCKKKGALTGTILSVVTVVWLVMGSIIRPPRLDSLPTSTTGCSGVNETITSGFNQPRTIPSGIYRFYHISFMWIVPFGFLLHVLISLVVSIIFGNLALVFTSILASPLAFTSQIISSNNHRSNLEHLTTQVLRHGAEWNTKEHVDPKYVWPMVRCCMGKHARKIPGIENSLKEPLSKSEAPQMEALILEEEDTV